VLVAQVVGLFLRAGALRLMLLVAGPLLIGAMLAYVSTRPVRPDEGAGQGCDAKAAGAVAAMTRLVRLWVRLKPDPPLGFG